jgi:hypothetical protein
VEVLVGIAGAVGDEFVVWDIIRSNRLFHVLELWNIHLLFGNIQRVMFHCLQTIVSNSKFQFFEVAVYLILLKLCLFLAKDLR